MAAFDIGWILTTDYWRINVLKCLLLSGIVIVVPQTESTNFYTKVKLLSTNITKKFNSLHLDLKKEIICSE